MWTEYGTTRNTTGALMAVKLRNQLFAIDSDLVVSLKNIRVNGAPMGCSGFITNPTTGKIVYVNTDHNHGTSYNHALYRTAEHTRDFTGGQNHFSDYANLARAVVGLTK